MPFNAHALIRYRAIDGCLQRRGRVWSWEELARACGAALRAHQHSDIPDPARRTIMTDLRDLRAGILGPAAPIVFDRRANGYRYADPHFSFDRRTVHESDLVVLQRALGVLQQLHGLGLAEALDEMTTRLADALQQQRPAARQVVHFSQLSADAPGRHWLHRLYEACLARQCLWLTYHPFDYPEPFRRAISPYLLKEYNKRWFLIGFDHDNWRVHTFALDRILQVEDNPLDAFHEAPHFQADTWFRHIVGVSMPYEATPTEVILRVLPARAKYLRSKPLHPSQTELPPDADGHPVFAFFLIPNFEWERLLLSYADEMVVLTPPALRDTIAARLQTGLSAYEVEM